jgi:hypothetical protein
MAIAIFQATASPEAASTSKDKAMTMATEESMLWIPMRSNKAMAVTNTDKAMTLGSPHVKNLRMDMLKDCHRDQQLPIQFIQHRREIMEAELVVIYAQKCRRQWQVEWIDHRLFAQV